MRYQLITAEQRDLIRKIAGDVLERKKKEKPNKRVTINILFSARGSEDRIIHYTLINSQLRKNFVDYEVGKHLYNILGSPESLEFLNKTENYNVKNL